MECSGKRAWSKLTRAELDDIRIDRPDDPVRTSVRKKWDTIAKPIDGMGRFEKITARIGAITGSDEINLSSKAVIVMCADNGIVNEGVTQTGQEVTALVAQSMAKGRSSVCRMGRQIGAKIIPIDIGINCDSSIEGVLDRKIRKGTRDFLTEPAMTEEEAVRAIGVGIDAVRECREHGVNIIAIGEMGIGNTTTATAVTSALLHLDPDRITGRGAGLSDEGLERKKQVINDALEKYKLDDKDALTVLEAVGGLDIAGLAGVCIGGAIYHVPIVLDGLITMAAALVAEKLAEGTAEYLIPSHSGREPAVRALEEALGMSPVIYGDLALGEGTGAVMMLSLLDLAMSIYHDNTDFAEIKVEQYKRYDDR
ncbi:MAG: nicotinate-nucleotide--dimethylbenzimidazole phosphoribosyltransferase [Lachnospiraceae bacterium]|nr:nicotinate-nucleotide--dimethylbenzimidazole phosphoribosyltransferase [Lachnospiraceae bacterium]